MLIHDQITEMEELFPFLLQLSESDRSRIYSIGNSVTLSEPKILLQSGEPCLFIPFVLSGSIRVFKVSTAGRQFTLYRIKPGGTCIFSLVNQLINMDYPVSAQSEHCTRLIMIPLSTGIEILERSLPWKDFVIKSVYSHFSDVIKVLELTIFERKDIQLSNWLLAEVKGIPGSITCTHEDIAADIGTVRVVVSRFLEDWQRKGLVKLNRGRIEILNVNLLRPTTEDSRNSIELPD